MFTKTNRNDRFKQMTKQQQLIEEKKRQIQEKQEEQRRKDAEEALKKLKDESGESCEADKPAVNMFSNDGSFLDHFRKLKEKGDESWNEGRAGKQKDRDRSRSPHADTQPISRPPLPPDFCFSGPPLPKNPPLPVDKPILNIPQPAPLIPQTIPPPGPLNLQNIPHPMPIVPQSIPPPLPPPPGLQNYLDQLPEDDISPCIKVEESEPVVKLEHPEIKTEPDDVPAENQGKCDELDLDNIKTDEDNKKLVAKLAEVRMTFKKEGIQFLKGGSLKDSFKIETPDIFIKEEMEDKIEVKDEKTAIQIKSERKRKSRWGDSTVNTSTIASPAIVPIVVPTTPQIAVTGMSGHMLSKVSRMDPGLVQYAISAYGSSNLSDEDWKKAEENYKVHLLYQDMMSKKAEVERLRAQGKHKYEYDSDEEVDGGTWEHKLREKEMAATNQWAESLTEMAKGKHHIGDFLPPDELKRFMDKYSAVKESGREPDLSDYKEFKLKEDNKGFQMLQKLGWTEGQGLGSDGAGILDPINKAKTRDTNEGLGIERPNDISEDDDEYDAYRKRMMLAYRFRPNPLV